MKILPGQPEWANVDLHLDRLLELPDEEWEQYLSRLESEPPAVVETLRELMAAHREVRARGLLESSILDLVEREGVGTRVGTYTLTALIGRGGMGKVWLALRNDGRFEGKFAVKFLDSYTASPAALDRFRREGRLLARLTHPHIARLIDAGVTSAGRPYLVLEYVQGERIDDYCDSHALDTDARIRLLLDVLEALAHAHTNLVIHRDIKPSNILVTESGEAKLLDFGIAKLLSAETGARDEPLLTRVEDSAFTPEYAAPEQILGEPPSTATDVYQVGVLLFALLAGRLPRTMAGTTRAERLKAALESEPPRLSEVAPPALLKALRGDLDAIVSKALRKLPQERYATAAALAEDLRRFLAHEPVRARADTLPYRARKFVRRRRGAVVTASAFALALLATAGIALWQAQRATRERDAALQAARRADSVGDFMSTILGDISRSSTPEVQRAYLDRARVLLAQQHYDDPLLRANLLNYLSGRYEEFGYPEIAVELLQEAKGALVRADNQADRAQIGCGLANLYDDLGRDAEAEREIETDMQQLEALGSRVRAEERSDCRLVQSYVDTALGKNRAAVSAARRSLAELEAAGVMSGMTLVTAENALARAYAHAGHNAEAVSLLRRIRAAESAGGAPQTIGAWIHEFNEATDLLAGGRVLEAQRLAAQLRSTARGGGSNSHDVDSLQAKALAALGRGSEARDLLHTTPAANASAEQLRAGLLEIEIAAEDGDTAGAREQWKAWEPAATAAIRAGGSDAAAALRTEGLLHLRSDPVGAEALLGHGAALAVDADGLPTPLQREINVLRAELDLQQGSFDKAAAVADTVVRQAEREAVNRASSAWIGEGLLLRARCAQARGDLAAMRVAAQAALSHLQENLGPDHRLTILARSLADSRSAASP